MKRDAGCLSSYRARTTTRMVDTFITIITKIGIMSSIYITLKNTQAKIKKHRENFQKNEENVRTQIINPILKSIGWNPEDPTQVQHNESQDLGFPDYSLKKRNKTVLFIEAKRMGIEIGKNEDLGQIGKYCLEKGVDFGVISNGSQWVLFKAFEKRQTLTESIVWKIDIERDDTEIILYMLETLSRTKIGDIKASSKTLQRKIKNQNTLKEDREKTMEETWKKIELEPDQIIKAFLPVFKSHANQPDLTKYKIRDPQISEFLKGKINHCFGNVVERDSQIQINSSNRSDDPITPKKKSDQIRKYFDLISPSARTKYHIVLTPEGLNATFMKSPTFYPIEVQRSMVRKKLFATTHEALVALRR